MATEAIISFVVENIGNLLIEEAKFLCGVVDKVGNLQRELKRLRCFMKDAEARKHKSESVRNYISEIREAAYDAEDVLETYVLEVAMRKGRGIKGALRQFVHLPDRAMTLHKIGTEINKIAARLSEIRASLQAYGVQEAIASESSDSWQARLREQRQSFPHVEDHDLVGLENSIEKLASDLVDDEKKFRVLSICGMGGLGKTTLARKLYNNDKVTRQFDHRAWAYISQQCQRRDTWEGILTSLSPESKRDRIVKMRDQELAKELHEVLSKKRCLVVLDDIWSTGAWDSLKVAFPDETRSRIILTSRKKEVGTHADCEGLLHQPQCLSDDESWDLLQKIIFSRKNYNSDFKVEEMEKLGRQMLNNCGGLPLAIRVLGGLLSRKYTLNHWNTVHDNIKSYIRKGGGQQQTYASVDNILSLSYDDLPSNLKSCFLYLALFPEDYEIDVQQLLRYWIAEGLVTSLQYDGENTMRVEDVAACFLDELIDRSMVLIGSTDIATSRVTTCQLHDLMREICLSKAKEECFLRIINSGSKDTNGDHSSSFSPRMYRRIAVHVFQRSSSFRLKLIKNHHLRSLLYITREKRYEEHLELMSFKDLKMLRVLDLENAYLERYTLKDIGKLIHLRFLSFRHAGVTKFPSSLGNLRLLGTLDLRVKAAYVPNVLWKLQRLRHLYLPISSIYTKSKLQLGNLKELQTLENFKHGVCDTSDLFNLIKLERLTISPSLYSKRRAIVEIMPSTLVSVLKNLQSLCLKDNGTSPVEVRQLVSGFTNLVDLTLDLRITKLPDSSHFPQGITRIILSKCALEEDPMPILETLPKLRSLRLYWAFIGKQMVCSGNGFPQLQLLFLHASENLEEWNLGEGGMPNLCSLDISSCQRIRALPEALHGIASLRELEIHLMPKSFRDRLVPGGEDFYKIQHVPSVIFRPNPYDEPFI